MGLDSIDLNRSVKKQDFSELQIDKRLHAEIEQEAARDAESRLYSFFESRKNNDTTKEQDEGQEELFSEEQATVDY